MISCRHAFLFNDEKIIDHTLTFLAMIKIIFNPKNNQYGKINAILKNQFKVKISSLSSTGKER